MINFAWIFFGTVLFLGACQCNRPTKATTGEQDQEQVATPVFSPVAGSYNGAQNIQITCTTEGAAIRYTMGDGTQAAPTKNDGELYTTAVNLTVCKTIKALAYKEGGADSEVVAAEFVIKKPLFVTVGSDLKAHYSSDGTNWQSSSFMATQGLQNVCFGNDMIFIIGSNGVTYYSRDVINWTTADIGADDFYDIAYGNGRFIKVGTVGNTHYFSATGASWSSAVMAGSNDIYGLIYATDRFVTCGLSGGTYWSTDGTAWNGPVSTGGGNGMAIAFGNNTFIIVDDGGDVSTSIDGSSWAGPYAVSATVLKGICYGKDRFVAVAIGGGSYWSYNGNSGTWNAVVVTGGSDLCNIAYGNGRFVAVGYNGETYWSTDGTSWSSANLAGSNTLYGVAFGYIQSE